VHLLLLGISHRTAPVTLRERVDFSARGVASGIAAVAERPTNSEAVVLSTCNRAELYIACEEIAPARGDLVQFLCDYHSLPHDELAPHLYDRVDAEAVRHLFRVAAGLDSLVVGEPQILGQVKDAFAVAGEQRAVGPLLNRLFHASFAVGKRVRSETTLGEGAVSVSYAAVELARKIFGALNGLTVLVIGAGEMGKLTVIHLKTHGIADVMISSRTTPHAAALAQALDARAVGWEEMGAALARADIVITATGSTVPILGKTQIAAATGRRTRPLFIIDIAVPRDIDPAAGELEQVFLYNIDDLQAVVKENLSRRAAEVSRAEAIIDEEVDRFLGWLRSRGAIPTVVALRQHFERIRRAEVERLSHGLSPDARARVDDITRLLVEKLLLSPTEQLKSIPDPNLIATYSDALTRLFSLGGDANSSAPEPEDLRSDRAVADSRNRSSRTSVGS
jgi:glutamyl-tRNA reductase